MSIEGFSYQIYAGVLGKIIGVYLGRPVEGWAYEDIRAAFDEVSYYVHDKVGVPLVVADDDISGTFAFVRSLEDNGYPRDITAKQIGDTWLNYIIEEKTILWWGGLGRSTEHTAYLNLKNGIEAPVSGASHTNGATISEQIGAQIFIDSWAMLCPGDPEKAASLAETAASVSHDGIAVEAAKLIAAAEAYAFVEKDLNSILDEGLRYVGNTHLLQMVDDVRSLCKRVKSWREARAWLDNHYGYQCYEGPCHIVPNHAMVITSLLLGGDNFQEALKIATSAGWDTDCNAGNVGCLNGIRLGLQGIEDGADFRTPVADRLLVVNADGGTVVSDAVTETKRLLRTSSKIYGQSFKISKKRYSFDFPGSVQGFSMCPYYNDYQGITEISNQNSSESSSGLNISFQHIAPGVRGRISTPVSIDYGELSQNFSTLGSPTLYSGQTVTVEVCTALESNPRVRLYILYYSETDEVKEWMSGDYNLSRGSNILTWTVPQTEGMPIFRFGIELSSKRKKEGELVIKSIDWNGAPRSLNLQGVKLRSIWNLSPRWVNAWVSSARHFAPDFEYTLCVSHPDENGVVSIGDRRWINYLVSATIKFSLHKAGGLVARMRGHRCYYAAMLRNTGEALIIENRNGQRSILASATFPYSIDRPYKLSFAVNCRTARMWVDDTMVLEAYLSGDFVHEKKKGGGAGFIVEEGTILVDEILVKELEG
jgi:ADP-ribosylglycohydrolase